MTQKASSPALEDRTSQITVMLHRWSNGDASALDDLTPFVYEELLRLAKFRVRKESGQHTLEPSALVHEVYLRLEAQSGMPLKNRAHFYAIAATTMKRVLVDYARKRGAQKRFGGLRVTLHPDLDAQQADTADLLLLDEALRHLAVFDARKSHIIELKYFGGLTTEEIAVLEQISVATVGRELRLGQAWLRRELGAPFS